MNRLLLLLAFFVFSIIIGFTLYSLTHNIVVQPVAGYNRFTFNFSYLLESANFEVVGYDEASQPQTNINKQFTHSLENADSSFTPEQALAHELSLEEISFLVPIQNAHKVKLTLNGKNNLAVFANLKINDREIALEEFIQKLASTGKFRIGKIHADKEVAIIQLLDDSVTFDITEVFKPLSLTKAEDLQFQQDYKFLNVVYFIVCALVIFACILLGYKKLTTAYYQQRKTDVIVNNGEVASKSNKTHKYDATSYVFSLLAFALLCALHTAFYDLIETFMLYIGGDEYTFADNRNLFEQNYLPALLLVITPLLVATLFTRKWLKALFCIPTIVLIVMLIVDNCLQIVLGVRFNIGFGGDYAGDLKYGWDFVEKFVLSTSGQLSLFALVAVFIASWYCIFKKIHLHNTAVKCYWTLLVLSCIWAVLPNQRFDDLPKLANVFQINGFSFYAIGNAHKSFSDDFAPRKNLDFQWVEHKGQNQHKNVIVLLVESWNCELTYACGTGPSFMPKLESLIPQSKFFKDYHATAASTSIATYSILKSMPSFAVNSDTSKYRKEFASKNDLVAHFKDNGYATRFFSSTDHVFGMADAINDSPFDEVITPDNAFKDITERYVFNSVNDEELFKYIEQRIAKEKGKFFYFTKTASNHSPYNSPDGFNDIKTAFAYTDKAVYNFIQHLKKSGFFNNGLLVICGDHMVWEDSGSQIHITDRNHMPLLLIDSSEQGSVNTVTFSHASLGVMLQDLMLPNYKMNRFNVNPLRDNNKSEILFGYDFSRPNRLSVRFGDKNTDIILNGDESSFKQEDVFTPEEQKQILGYLAWFK